MIFRHYERDVPLDQLVKLGSKRSWVPMWLWINIVFRFHIEEIWPIGLVFYKKA